MPSRVIFKKPQFKQIPPGLSGWEYEAAYWIDPSAYGRGMHLKEGMSNLILYLSNPQWIDFNVGFGASHDFSIHPETEC